MSHSKLLDKVYKSIAELLENHQLAFVHLQKKNNNKDNSSKIKMYFSKVCNIYGLHQKLSKLN